VKAGDEFAPSQRRDGSWCRRCFRESYVERSGGMQTRACEQCGASFFVTPRSLRKYCGSSCKARATQDRLNKRLREQKTGRVCAHCSGPISPDRYITTNYCSEQCRRAHVGPAIARRSMLKRTYGITVEQYDALVAAQDGHCAICDGTDPGSKGVWYVDHCHKSNAVRGLLCSPCNTGLGHFRDDTHLLARAIEYLTSHRLE
jgi:hypothetical protein